MTAFAPFVEDLRGHPHCSELADVLLADFQRLDSAAVHSRDNQQFRKALLWIATHPTRTVDEKIVAMKKLHDLPDAHILIPNLRVFLGW